MMNELMQQNKRMESLLVSMTSEMKTLRQEVTQLRGEEPSVHTSLVFFLLCLVSSFLLVSFVSFRFFLVSLYSITYLLKFAFWVILITY